MAKAVVIYGPPGSGKGTQANLLAWTKNFIHFDTGKYLEQVVHDPENKNPQIKKERELFDSGVLLTPSFVLKVTSEKSEEIAKAGYSIVFSGSPRTLYEAFGDENTPGLIAILEKAYRKENLFFLFLKIKPEVSIQRNANRLVCSICATAILYSDAAHKHKTCPLCGAELRKRTVDNPAVFETRIKEYEERTKPIVTELKKKGYKINDIDGAPMPFRVFDDVKKALNLE